MSCLSKSHVAICRNLSIGLYNIELVEIFIPIVSARLASGLNWFESWFKLAYLCITWLSCPLHFLIFLIKPRLPLDIYCLFHAYTPPKIKLS